MSTFEFHTPLAKSPSIQKNALYSVSSDQQSQSPKRSVSTIQRAHSYRPSGSARSLGSSSQAGRRIGNENLALRRDASHSSILFSSYPTDSSSARRTSKPASHKSSWESDVPTAPHEQWVSSLPVKAGPFEDIDLNAGCGEDLSRRNKLGHDGDSIEGRGLSFDVRKQETLSTPKSTSIASREVVGLRSFNIASEHTYKGENPVKRLVGNLRAQGPKRRHSLTVRKERWILDDFDEIKPTKVDLPQSRRFNGHQKASSWASSGIRNAIKSATHRLQSATNRSHSPVFSRARLLRTNGGSRMSNATSRLSMDSDQVAALEDAAMDRAVQRRRVLEELVSSEESYVADLKILLHVGGSRDSSSNFHKLKDDSQVYMFMLDSAPKGPQATQPEISQNVADLLRLHEDILLQIKAVMPNTNMKSDALTGQQPRHRRWYSVESMEVASLGYFVKKARLANDFSWFGSHRGSHKDRTLITTPGEAADIARVFERTVWNFNLPILENRSRLIADIS